MSAPEKCLIACVGAGTLRFLVESSFYQCLGIEGRVNRIPCKGHDGPVAGSVVRVRSGDNRGDVRIEKDTYNIVAASAETR